MPALNASDLLQIWEWGQGRSPLQQALMILAVAYPDCSPAQLAALPIGQRDAHLLMLRSHTFGSRLQATATCPQCQEALEFELMVNDICLASPPPLTAATASETKSQYESQYEWNQGNYRLTFRLPTSADLLALAESAEPHQLLQRCLIHLYEGEKAISMTELPRAIAQQVIEQIAQRDPQAEIVLNLRCPACGHQWAQLFDIISFFWREIAFKAQRLLQEVHVLATVYSWSEADILSMSALRRQAYLEQIGGTL
jgi:hypothetical protein